MSGETDERIHPELAEPLRESPQSQTVCFALDRKGIASPMLGAGRPPPAR